MKNGIKSNNGYTLIEMIIVIAIIAVMSGVGFLTISSIRGLRQLLHCRSLIVSYRLLRCVQRHKKLERQSE